jgi:hypothetical protein
MKIFADLWDVQSFFSEVSKVRNSQIKENEETLAIISFR